MTDPDVWCSYHERVHEPTEWGSLCEAWDAAARAEARRWPVRLAAWLRRLVHTWKEGSGS